MNSPLKYIICALCLFWLCSCAEKPVDPQTVAQLPPIYPDYVDVTIPTGIAPLNFNVLDDGVESVYVEVMGSDGTEMTAQGMWAKFDVKKWHDLTYANRGGTIAFTVYAKVSGKWLKYLPFDIKVSEQPIDEWGLTYRRIAPGYEVYSAMGLYQRCLSDFDESPIIENTLTAGQCYNCHTANRTNPDEFLFHIRGDHGGTMVQKNGECTLLQAKNDSIGGSLVYPYWHPSGRYCAFSTNQTRQGFHIAGEKRVEVFDLSSDILVFDTDKCEIILDTLINTKDWSENSPSFSPDGKWLYFTTCLQKEYPLEYTDEQYNLCRIAFDAESGRFGSQVDTLFNAVEMGKSVSWPRPSYDGKHILFTLSDYGYFSIWHPESDQWILDLATGEAKPLEASNSDNADSYHNWSDNSRWIVFTSRRGDGLYSQLFISHIDADGNASKPFLLPQENPLEYYSNTLFSFNTPDFTKKKVDFDAHSCADAILSSQRKPTAVRQ